MSDQCSICRQDIDSEGGTHLSLYCNGSEGITVCFDCRMILTEHARNMTRLASKCRMAGYKDGKGIRSSILDTPYNSEIEKVTAVVVPPNGWFGSFVTAKLRGEIGCRQGWVISVNPLRIRGESGTEYDCEGDPTIAKPLCTKFGEFV